MDTPNHNEANFLIFLKSVGLILRMNYHREGWMCTHAHTHVSTPQRVKSLLGFKQGKLKVLCSCLISFMETVKQLLRQGQNSKVMRMRVMV